MKNIRMVLIALCALTLSDTAIAGWREIVHYPSPPAQPVNQLADQSDGYVICGLLPGLGWGYGWASDDVYFEESRVSLKGTGYEYRSWRHESPGVGEVEMVKDVKIHGQVKLQSADCAARAVGWSMAEHWFDNVPDVLRVEAKQSVAATSSSEVAQVNLSLHVFGVGIELSIPVTVSEGTGEYVDDGGGRQVRSYLKCPVGIFEYDRRVHLDQVYYADGTPLSEARCEGQCDGHAIVTYQLLEHSQCP